MSSPVPHATPIRILYASADRQVRLLREMVLRQHGFFVESSISERHAMELLSGGTFDVLLLGHTVSARCCCDFAKEFRARNPGGRVVEILPNWSTIPKNNPDAIVESLASPDELVKVLQHEVWGDSAA